MQHCCCKGPFFHSPWMRFQLQSRAFGFDLGNSMVCTYLWEHLPCLFLKPGELEGKVLFFLRSPEKHSFILLPSVGFNNCPLSSYNILQCSHPWERAAVSADGGCGVGSSAFSGIISETRAKALFLLKWMVRFLKYVPIHSFSTSFWFCAGCEQKLGAWKEEGVSKVVSGWLEENGRRKVVGREVTWKCRVLLTLLPVCWYVDMCRMGDLEANEMSLEPSPMLFVCNGCFFFNSSLQHYLVNIY